MKNWWCVWESRIAPELCEEIKRMGAEIPDAEGLVGSRKESLNAGDKKNDSRRSKIKFFNYSNAKHKVQFDIVFDHAINGVRTGKHSSGNWKEYNALFTVGEDGVPRDSDGVAMPGTEKQAQSGMAGVLQGLWGGILSGAEKLFQPSTSSGVEDPYANLGYPDYASGNIPANISQPSIRSEGDDTRGDNPIDIIRSTYDWASSLPNNVLFNAAGYPDYLRLLIEYDAAAKDLPLTVPTWILEGTARPEEDEERNNLFADHPAMQTQELTWQI